MAPRTITNGDIWSAARGLGMFQMDEDEIRRTIRAHAGSPMFASQVIAEAACQVLAVKVNSRKMEEATYRH